MTKFAHRPRRFALARLVAVGATAGLSIALAACAPPTRTSTVTTAPTSSSTASHSSGTQTAPASGPTVAPTATTHPAPTAAAGPARCTYNHLSLALSEGGGGAAGSRLPYIVFTNTGSATCELHGWPGVSFVGNGNGTQLGAAADFDSSVAIATVTLAPGGTAHAPLKVTVAENYDAAACQPSATDGIRVYPPGETHAMFIATTAFTACLDASVHLLTVQAIVAGS